MDHQQPLPVIIDVDTGIDDAMALALALRSPEFDVRAITCVGGNTSLENVVRNTQGVVRLIATTGRSGVDQIPIAQGIAAPLMSFAGDASHVHGSNGLAGIELPVDGMRIDPLHAIERMRREIEESDQPITIVALAPLTNIAILFRMYPALVARVERVVFMGGAIGIGNATASAEFNTWSDPEAAEIVIGSGVPITMYGLEPFYATAMTSTQIETLCASTEPLRAFVGRILAHTAGTASDDTRFERSGSATIGDAGVLCMLIDPSLVETRELPVEVSLDAATRGQTIVDRRGSADVSVKAHQVRVVTGIDGDRACQLFLDRI